MTTLNSAFEGTKDLLCPGYECPTALWASLGSTMLHSFMHLGDTARSAQGRPASRFSAALFAMTGEPSGAGQLPAMFFFVARNTKRQAIIDLGNEFWIVSKRFYVVCMKFLALCATSLAGVIISFIDCRAPFGQFHTGSRPFATKASAAFPCCGPFPSPRFHGARLGTIERCFISAIEFLAAKFTQSRLRWIAMRPASFGAIARGAIGFVFKFLAANFASMECPLTSMFAPNRVEAFHRAEFLRVHSRLKDLAANFARAFNQFLNTKVVASNEFGRGEFAPCACRKYGLTASALAYIHSPHYTIYCAVMQARLQRMLDAFGIRGELVE